MAVEGGPGYSSGGSRDWYYELYEPLLDRRQLLLVDLRGTGLSNAILCEPLQSYVGNWPNMIGKCGRQLGQNSDVWGSAFAADDVVEVLDHLGIDKIDLYGDSYGTFFGQTFAVRHPDRTRTLTLDAAYFVGGKNPWYPDTNRAIRHAFTSPANAVPRVRRQPGSAMGRITKLAQTATPRPAARSSPERRGRHSPDHGHQRRPRADPHLGRDQPDPVPRTRRRCAGRAAPQAVQPAAASAGSRGHLRWRRRTLPGVLGRSGSGRHVQRLPRTVRPARPDQGSAGPVRGQRAQALRPRSSPRSPGANGSTASPAATTRTASSGRSRADWVPAVPADATYPDIPVLIFDGDLDSLTSPDGARDTARALPQLDLRRDVQHDARECARGLELLRLGDRAAVRPHPGSGRHVVPQGLPREPTGAEFRAHRSQTDWDGPANRTARIANATAADVMARWYQMYGATGVGLRGGTFSYSGGYFTDPRPVVTWKLKDVRWVRDVSVERHRQLEPALRAGRRQARRRRQRGRRVTRAGAWNDKRRHAKASATVYPTSGPNRHFTFPSA